MKVLEYITIYARGNSEALDARVNEHLSKGYELYGDPYTTKEGSADTTYYHQAMVKYED